MRRKGFRIVEVSRNNRKRKKVFRIEVRYRDLQHSRVQYSTVAWFS